MLYEITTPQFIKSLRVLSTLLKKGAALAEAKKFDIEVLLTARLAPDQFPLARQIQIVCDTARLAASRLTAKEAPVQADTEKTLAEFQIRIDNTIAYLQTFSAKDYAEAATRKISQPRGEGKYLLGEDYVIQHVIPNFYFHLTTAYAILRHNGVDIGKKDYLGELPFRN